MIDAPVAFVFGLGMVATVNPCGFAMLPAYLSYFLGTDDRSPDARAGVLRALAVGASVSAGFMAVFAVMGVAITQFSLAIEQNLPWVTIAVGIALALLGVAMVRGFQPVVNLPKLQKGTDSRQLPSMFLFGVSYAVCSLSCTIPIFLVNVATTFTAQDFLSGMAVFVAYASGMALVLMSLTLMLALARQGLVQRIRRSARHVNRVSGVLLVVAGCYLAYYGWYSLRVYGGDTDPGGPADLVYRWNAELTNWITATGPLRIGMVLLGVIALALVVATGWRSGRPARERAHTQ